MSAGHTPTDRRHGPHPAWLAVSLLAAAGIGLVFLGYYWVLARIELFDCVNLVTDAPDPPMHLEGAEHSSVYAAALTTIAVWLVAFRLVRTTRLCRWPLLIVPIFAVLDLAALLALWGLAPVIWGPEHCVAD